MRTPNGDDSDGVTGQSYSCDVDAEPLQRYRKGGYHPTHLGDVLNNGRCKIMHKLGWGGYSTVWLAKDLEQVLCSRLCDSFRPYDLYLCGPRLCRPVAMKIQVSELRGVDSELEILNFLANGPAGHRGRTTSCSY